MIIAWKSASQDRSIASFRYRVETPVEALRLRGHDVEIFAHARVHRYETVVFSKAYSAKDIELAERLKAGGTRILLDICDNHFYNPYRLASYEAAAERLRRMISLADGLICSTPELGRRLEQASGVMPCVVGDFVERIELPSRNAAPSRARRLLWFGSHGSPNAPSGMADLLLIAETLEAFAVRSSAELTVLSNNAAKYERLIRPMRIPSRYVAWEDGALARELLQVDAVILPISRNPFSDCKTHNRLSLALCAGLPVIATGIDSYREFGEWCVLDDFERGLAEVADDLPRARTRTESCRLYLDRAWSDQSVAVQWETALGLAECAPVRADDVGDFQGHLDPTAGPWVTGWVRNLADLPRKLNVVLEVCGEAVASGIADAPRPDLAVHGLSPADCGFALRKPAFATSGRWRVRVLGTTFSLA